MNMHKPRHDRLAAALLVLAAALLVYLLGIGPAFRASYFGTSISMDTFDTVYAPVTSMADRFTFISKTLDWYVGCWTESAAQSEPATH
jgi:hypothetical protein